MDQEIAQIVARIHDTPQQSVLAVAGAGNYALAWLLGSAERHAPYWRPEYHTGIWR